MESFFFLRKGPEERLAQSILYQWTRTTYRDPVALTLENCGMFLWDSKFLQHDFVCQIMKFLLIPVLKDMKTN